MQQHKNGGLLMKLNPIIVSLLETDMYKFSMGSLIIRQPGHLSAGIKMYILQKRW